MTSASLNPRMRSSHARTPSAFFVERLPMSMGAVEPELAFLTDTTMMSL